MYYVCTRVEVGIQEEGLGLIEGVDEMSDMGWDL